MKTLSQEEQMESLMKRPKPKKKVGIVKLKKVRDGTMLYGTERFQDAQGGADMIRPLLECSDREMMVVLSLDAVSNPIAIEIVAVGGLCSCMIDPRDIFKHAILSNAAHIIIGVGENYYSYHENYKMPFDGWKEEKRSVKGEEIRYEKTGINVEHAI